jgi:hypothetical protein
VEVLVGLAGVVIGWLLSVLTDWLRRNREAATAARFVYLELAEARTALDVACDLDGDLIHLPSRVAWEAHAARLLEGDKRGRSSLPIMTAYSSIQSDVSMIQWLKADAEDRMRRLHDAQRRGEELPADASQSRRDALASEIRLLVENMRKADPIRDKYVADIRTSTLPKIDEALAVLAKKTGMSSSS